MMLALGEFKTITVTALTKTVWDDKCNSITPKATDLIFSLFGVASA